MSKITLENRLNVVAAVAFLGSVADADGSFQYETNFKNAVPDWYSQGLTLAERAGMFDGKVKEAREYSGPKKCVLTGRLSDKGKALYTEVLALAEKAVNGATLGL